MYELYTSSPLIMWHQTRPWNATLAAFTINVKNCGSRFISNPPLLRTCQSATTNNIKTHQTSTKVARRLTWALRHWGSTFQPQTMAYCVGSVTPSADLQRSRLHINNNETRTAINDIMPPDEYQAFSFFKG